MALKRINKELADFSRNPSPSYSAESTGDDMVFELGAGNAAMSL
jgi:ubiquitin-protein ligase